MSEQVSLSAIVVNHQGRELLAACLASLDEALAEVAGATELIVVDNASDDGSVRYVRERHPEVELVVLDRNRGFAAAVNEALRRSRSHWVLLLNNDATLERTAARLLLDTGGRSADVGSVAAQLRFAGADAINSAGIVVDTLGVASDRLLGEPAASSEREPVDVFGASGGAALYRRAMLEDVGGFDGSFFVYLEDADLAWRARMRGWRCLYEPRAVAHHRYSATAVHGSGFKYFHAGRNRVRLLAKNAVPQQLLRHGPRMIAYDLAYVAGVAMRDRTLAPLAGRVRGLREWRRYRAAGSGRRAVALAPARGVRGGLRRRASWRRHAAPPASPRAPARGGSA